MSDDPRRMGWWIVWLRRRRIDDHRLWCGGRGRPAPRALSERTYRHGGALQLPDGGGWEDQAVEMMDARVALRSLAPRERVIVGLTAYGYTGVEIAARLGCTAGRVSQVLSGARERLREFVVP